MEHSLAVLSEWEKLIRILEDPQTNEAAIDGKSLDLATVVSIARSLQRLVFARGILELMSPPTDMEAWLC